MILALLGLQRSAGTFAAGMTTPIVDVNHKLSKGNEQLYGSITDSLHSVAEQKGESILRQCLRMKIPKDFW